LKNVKKNFRFTHLGRNFGPLSQKTVFLAKLLKLISSVRIHISLPKSQGFLFRVF
jgi:hypothetical protein